jgi:hypothetical protein
MKLRIQHRLHKRRVSIYQHSSRVEQNIQQPGDISKRQLDVNGNIGTGNVGNNNRGDFNVGDGKEKKK